MKQQKTLTEEVEILFRTINRRGWRKPKMKSNNGFWKPPRRGKIENG